MNELIKLNETEIDDKLVQTVNARELHAFLEVGRDFSNWIKARLETLGSIENEDYLVIQEVFTKIGEKGGRPKIEYYLTLDVAKHLAMMEKNEKGLQIRQYFIECEKQLKQVMSTKDSLLLGIFKAEGDVNKALAINAYEEQYVKPLENKVEEQENELHIVRPKGDYFDLLVDRNLLTNFRDTAKEFCIGQKVFINFLIENKYIYRDSKGKLKPYQLHIDTGLFELKEFVNGGYTDVQTLVTPKGRETFRLLLELMLTNT